MSTAKTSPNKDLRPRTPPRGSGRGRSGGGRTPMGGRSLVTTDGRGQQPRSPAVSVHSSSGVPFGHVPAYLPGSASLVEELDKRVLIVLRDGKHLIGVSSFSTYQAIQLLAPLLTLFRRVVLADSRVF